jgi:hypothetical protein
MQQPKDDSPRGSARQTRYLLTKFFRGQGLPDAKFQHVVDGLYDGMVAANKKNPRPAPPKT